MTEALEYSCMHFRRLARLEEPWPAERPRGAVPKAPVGDTHDSGQVSLELLDDARETPARHVQQFPAPAHGFAIPSRVLELAGRGDVAIRFVPELVLQKSAELERMREQQDEHRKGAHYFDEVVVTVRLGRWC